MKTSKVGFQESFSGTNPVQQTRYSSLCYWYLESNIFWTSHFFFLFISNYSWAGCIWLDKVLRWKILRKETWKTGWLLMALFWVKLKQYVWFLMASKIVNGFNCLWLSFLFWSLSFNILRYQLDFITKGKFLQNMILIIIKYLEILSLSNFLNQNIEIGLVNIHTFFYIKNNTNRITFAQCIQP